jgi:transposase
MAVPLPIGATMTPVPRPTVSIDRGVLVDLYVERGLSMPQVGAELGVSRTAVRARMVELGIPRRFRSPGPAWRGPYRSPAEILTRRYLLDVYRGQGTTVNAIAAQTGISTATVRRYLDLHGIARRGRGYHVRVPVDRRQLARWCRTGVTAADMAEWLGCSKSTVYDLLRRFGFTEHRRVKPDIDRDQLAGLRAHGLSIAEVADRLGCSMSTARRAMVRWGMPTSSRVPTHIIDPGQLAGLRADGMTVAAIAARFGCSPSTVRRALVRAGISRRDKSSTQAKLRRGQPS